MKRLFFLGFLAFCGCKDEPEQIPAYLRIEPFTVNAEGGAGWQKITDGWLYVDGEFLGAYTLPATVPVLHEGDKEVIVFPGVKENGITALPNIYPFLTRFTQTRRLTPGETIAVQPATAYDGATVFTWSLARTSFDGGSAVVLESRDGDPLSDFELTTEGAFAGKSIRMAVDTSHPLIEIATEPVELPATYENPVWLELHYRSDMPFSLFLLGQTGGQNEVAQAVYGFSSTEGAWNKTYFNLSEFLVALNQQEQYRLFFRVSLPLNDNGQPAQNAGTVYLDNIRLLHF